MSQPWYGQHGSSAAPAHGPQASIEAMNLHSYHSGVAGVPGAQGNAFLSHRNSPNVGRPPSSASTASNASYHAVTGPSSAVQGQAQPHNMSMVNGPPPPMGHLHSSMMHHHVPTPRYPMPPRNIHQLHHMAGGPAPGRPTHGIPPSPSPSVSQPLRQISDGNTLRQEQLNSMANSHSRYIPAKPPASVAMVHTMGHAPLHHPMPYRHHPRVRPMGGPGHGPTQLYQHHQFQHQGYHHNPTRGSFPSLPLGQNLTGVQQHHEVKYANYQRPFYESPETVVDNSSLSRSPSPPPAPPSHNSNNAVGGGVLAPSTNGKAAEKPNVTADPVPSKGNAVTEDDDAASILLQLSGIPSQAPNNENNQDEANRRPMSTIQTENRGSPGTHSAAHFIKPIGSAPSSDEDATVNTTDCAPDLTSEPSGDSIEVGESEFPAAIPENFPTRLALPHDDAKLNSLHCFLRSELLEVFVVRKSSHKSPTHSPGSSVGRVGLRCVHCAMVRKHQGTNDEAPMAVFYPKSIAEIYRLVTSWQRCHLRKCRNLPPAVRSKWQSLRETDKSRGKTHYWITSAREIGLQDCQSRAGGIRFGPNTKGCVAQSPALQLESTPEEPDHESMPTTTSEGAVETAATGVMGETAATGVMGVASV